jgi:lipopolysaccharide/colanic/teichoic acid biosynthesis glycosyltransferase
MIPLESIIAIVVIVSCYGFIFYAIWREGKNQNINKS